MRRPRSLAILLLVAVWLTACHRPKPPSLRQRAAALLAIVKPVVVHVDAKAVLKQAAHKTTDRAIDQAADQASRSARTERPRPEPEPEPEPDRVQPEPQPTAPPPMKIDRIDASKPTVFVARWQTRGGKASCEVHATKDECTRACTALLQAHAMRKPDNNTPQGCTCLEQDGGC